MSYQVTQTKTVTWEEDVDSSDDEYEEDHSIYFESRSQPYWFCEGCKTCITKQCHVDANKQHFQLNKQTGQYFPTLTSMNGKTAHLIIHRFKDTEIFGYFLE
jgi:hypothetical protein